MIEGSRFILSLAAAVGLAVGAAPAGAASLAELYAAGDLEAAEALAAAQLAGQPATQPDASPEAALLQGRLALLGNHLEAADRWLTQARAAAATAVDAVEPLAELRYRQLRFADAAALLREAGETARADQLASLAGKGPYALDAGSPATLELPFVQTDPLPLVEARINGSDPVFLLVDTGASELTLDPEFAAAIGARTFGKATGTFGGGTQAEYELGSVDSLALGEWTLRDVPVRLLPTRRFAAVTGGRQVDGVLGTNVFYRFRSTLDYPAGALRLERVQAGEKAAVAACAVEIPFWMAGDHFLLARGAAGDLEPGLLLVDTGLAGPAFAAPRSTLDALAVEVDEENASEGMSGGGKIRVAPFGLSRLSLGPVVSENLVGIAGAFPEKLEHALGVHVTGLVSHAFFRSYALTFDFQSMRLVLTPGEGCGG
jgi:Aspartyl protease